MEAISVACKVVNSNCWKLGTENVMNAKQKSIVNFQITFTILSSTIKQWRDRWTWVYIIREEEMWPSQITKSRITSSDLETVTDVTVHMFQIFSKIIIQTAQASQTLKYFRCKNILPHKSGFQLFSTFTSNVFYALTRRFFLNLNFSRKQKI